jgi:hypothetical protein
VSAATAWRAERDNTWLRLYHMFPHVTAG